MSPFNTSSIPRALAAVVSAVGLVVGACGGDENGTSTTTAASPVLTSASATPDGSAAASEAFSDADVEFAQRMIAHHEQAIEMAEIAQDPARQAGADVMALAGRIQAAQDVEIALMTGWLDAWGQPLQMDTSDGHDMSEMTGMMSADEMDALAAEAATGFDDLWLAMMVEHHQGAIEMATALQTDGTSPDAKVLAGQIIAAQEAEVDEMRQLLDS